MEQPSASQGHDLEDLVPRMRKGGYDSGSLARRRAWVESRTGTPLQHVGSCSLQGEDLRGNIENPIGAAQVPLGVAGPLLIEGEHARGTFYVPMATSEGALIRSYERGMVALSRSGGVEAAVAADENQISPTFFFESVQQAVGFTHWVRDHFDEIRSQAQRTTRHGRLLRIDCRIYGPQAIANFGYSTGDAQGMNMIVKATDRACRWIAENYPVRRFHIFSGMSSEKRASGFLLARGKGKWATASAQLSDSLTRRYLGCSAQELHEVWHYTALGHLAAHSVGCCAQYANALAAIFIATGQDVANVANASAGITDFALSEEGVRVSVTLPGLEVASVGGGTALATQRECLEMMGCFGQGKSAKLAEIIAAAVLAGEISMAGAIAAGEFAQAHERYGRNRPPEEADSGGEPL